MDMVTDFTFPLEDKSKTNAERYVFRKMSRGLVGEKLVQLQEAWFNLTRVQRLDVRELPGIIIRVLTTRVSLRKLRLLAAFTYLNNIPSEIFKTILSCLGVEDDFIYLAYEEILMDYDDEDQGERIRNVTISYNMAIRLRTNLNGEIWYHVDFEADKENIDPRMA